ncbi:hypothetical protein [Phytohabitans rumicis]|uniref:Uncharacterized protein n=1 Tax=Phytohabitans rumicis TaxID=1076125 RepID=A0A6V8LPD5_9ACTN|nr:hypothetical protein [Phytohabitans rumicis]GFJ96076.1 hypothetical protein Prum_097180 [Phytohabitans rumicis]
MTADLLARYAERFHAAVGGGHHVASPLGAWLLLALCAPAATGAARDELAEVLGTDPATAAATAGALLDHPHPLVAAASAVWHRPAAAGDGLAGWTATLPASTRTGPMPDQAQADAWAREHTFGLIERFPLAVTPEVVLLLASALATKVSWEVPFEVAPAAALGPGSPWAGRLTRVLRTPEQGHWTYVAATKRAGDVIVHVASADPVWSEFTYLGGLHVVSVAAAPDVAPADVLAAAYEIAPIANDQRRAGRRSLYDLPLGDGPLWTIRDEQLVSRDAERCTAVLPSWSAGGEHDLRAPGLGFATAGRVVADMLGLPSLGFEARQAAVAAYSRYGFEAAAVTGFASVTSAPSLRAVRVAELRFGHPYAVVAVATQRDDGPWGGVPVFSAWVSEPDDVPESPA